MAGNMAKRGGGGVGAKPRNQSVCMNVFLAARKEPWIDNCRSSLLCPASIGFRLSVTSCLPFRYWTTVPQTCARVHHSLHLLIMHCPRPQKTVRENKMSPK